MRISLLMIGLVLGPGLTLAAEPVSLEHFEKKIRPLLAEHCFKCHGSEEQKSGLRLDTREGFSKGGKRGAVITAGKPDESRLIQAVRRQGELQMPPKGKLSVAQVADLELWVRQGAAFPEKNAILAMKANHWAFQPIKTGPLPKPHGTAWVNNPVDAFILADLEKAKLSPSPEADKLTLVRRVCFDLTGLPPTPEETRHFQTDVSAKAYENMVNRYLASPAYGERWGRHWLDVARYADSNGLDENVAHGNAWRYRDYVVAAFNNNMPYNQFILEQIAGDLLPSQSLEEKHLRSIATGYLVLGPKVLAEVDKQKMEMDIIDEQIDTLGKTFLGMTLGCARCHDHKFDPIATAEYYSLAGVFKSTKTMESLVTIAKWNENSLASAKEQKQVDEHTSQVSQSKKKAEDFLGAQRKKLEEENKLKDKKAPAKEVEAALGESAKAELKKLREETAALEKAAPDLPSAMGVNEGKVTEVAIHIRGSTDRLGKMMPRAVPVALSQGKPPVFTEKTSGRLELARWLASPSNPLTARVMVNRVWRWHFGQGLVPSTDNFGLLGEKPTHPQLLDWLANHFIEEKWSIKDLHRTILFSSAYRQASAVIAENAVKDPGGKLYWRFTPRRLEGEVLRDSLLSVSGQLDKTMGGSLLQVKNRAFFFDHTSKDMTKYDSLRRSIYLPVVRNNLYPVFSLFDGTDAAVANGDRAVTTIAPQALFFLNGKLVLDCAEALAKKALQASPDFHGQVQYLYSASLGRSATEMEAARGKEFLLRAGQLPGSSPLQALAAFSQVVLSCNEFVTLR